MRKIWGAIRRYFTGTDTLALVLALALSALSMVLLVGINRAGYVRGRVVLTQAVAVALGLVACTVLTLLDYDRLASFWKLYLPPVLALMALTYTSLGVDIQGNKSWLNLFNLTSIQPSEFLKIAVILSFSYHLAQVRDSINKPRTLLPLLLHGFLPVGLIMLQKDWGVALVMFLIICGMLFIAGLSWKLVAAGLGALAAAAPLVWFFVLSDNRKSRFLALLDPMADPKGVIWQQLQGRIAMGSGQMFGIGLFSDAHRYVPEQYNDFIFTFLGESFGFMGCLAVIAAYAVLLARILHTARHAKDDLGKFLCVGVFTMLLAQIVINLGMCLMLLPVVGITLPLLSQGGSSVLGVYLALGLVFSVRYHGQRAMFTNL